MQYRVEVEYWTRSYDGDDWVTGDSWKMFDSYDEALEYAKAPYRSLAGLIESKVFEQEGKKLKLIAFFDFTKQPLTAAQ